MKIFALMKYGDLAASTRQRMLQYLPYLSSKGISVEWTSLLTNDYVRALSGACKADALAVLRGYGVRLWQLLSKRDFDVLWIYAELFPYLPGIFERWGFVSGRPVVYDFDDAIFHQYDENQRMLVRGILGGKLEVLLRGAAACCCGNVYLKNYAGRFCENSVVIPTVVDTDLYVPASGIFTRTADVVIGWIGSPSTWSHLRPLMPTLCSLREKGGVKIRVVGSGDWSSLYPEVEFISWTKNGELAELQRMDVGIMPLPDEPWTRGKSGYKLVQYMACGLPVIASPVGGNLAIVEGGVSGFFASSETEWQMGLERLIKDRTLRVEMGKRGREKVVREYSLRVYAPRMEELIRSVVG